MKANELMIGDYVRYKSSKHIIQIENILEDGVNCEVCQGDLDYVEEDRIEPIPLTKEILKANGFEILIVNKICAAFLHQILSIYDFGHNKGWLMRIGDTDISFKYVHELQHALRLSGLDKCADDFMLKQD